MKTGAIFWSNDLNCEIRPLIKVYLLIKCLVPESSSMGMQEHCYNPTPRFLDNALVTFDVGSVNRSVFHIPNVLDEEI